MAVSARRTLNGVAVTVASPPHVKVTHPPSLVTTKFCVEIIASGHSRVKIVIIIIMNKGCRFLNVPHLSHVGADSHCRSCFLRESETSESIVAEK